MTIKRYPLILDLLVCFLLLTACVDFNISNLSELNARVLIQTPDGGNYTKSVESSGYASSFSGHGGNYTISVVPDEQYLQLLRDLRQQITQRLFEEKGVLSAEDVARLVQNLQDIEKQIEKEAERGASCSGAAPDFSTVSATITWSEAEGDWAISCGVVSDEG